MRVVIWRGVSRCSLQRKYCCGEGLQICELLVCKSVHHKRQHPEDKGDAKERESGSKSGNHALRFFL